MSDGGTERISNPLEVTKQSLAMYMLCYVVSLTGLHFRDRETEPRDEGNLINTHKN